MIEDEYYRASTQYRYWSYTVQQLADLRQQTNQVGSDKVKAAFRRARAQRTRNGTNGASNDPVRSNTADVTGENGSRVNPPGEQAQAADAEDVHIETLTVEEEQKIVEWGCGKVIEMGEAMRPRVPGGVVATAIQYLRRFYLTNSPMTYHPKSILLCCLFLSCKSDHFYLSLRRFIEGVDPDGEAGITEDDVKAPEFLLLQGLRFTLEVRHAFVPLRGGVADLIRMGKDGRIAHGDAKGVGKVADKVKAMLKRKAQMTDVYFLFTPSHIWLGALWAVDRDLAAAYLEAKFEELAEHGMEVDEKFRERVLETVQKCAEVLMSYRSPEDDKAQRREMNRIGKKLIACQNPEKADIVAVARAKAAEKREGSESDADLKKKKRKLERERAQRDGDVFGGELKDGG